jgi:hypothetical protein
MGNFNFNELLAGTKPSMHLTLQRAEKSANDARELFHTITPALSLDEIIATYKKALELYLASAVVVGDQHYIKNKHPYYDITKKAYDRARTVYLTKEKELADFYNTAFDNAIKHISPAISYTTQKSVGEIKNAIDALRTLKLEARTGAFGSYLLSVAPHMHSSGYLVRNMEKKIDGVINQLEPALNKKVEQEEVKREETGKDVFEQEEKDKKAIADSEAFQAKLPLYLGIGGAAIAALLLFKGS